MKVLCTLFIGFFINLGFLQASDSLSLYLFLLDDCPICIQYTPTLNELYNEYGEDIEFVGYFPNFSSKKHKIETFRKTYNIRFALHTDFFKEQSKRFKAEVTPEVVLYDHETQKVIYQGRIDNKFYQLGRRRHVITEHDLKNAIEASLKGEVVKTTYAQPIGCYINYSDNLDRNTRIDKE